MLGGPHSACGIGTVLECAGRQDEFQRYVKSPQKAARFDDWRSEITMRRAEIAIGIKTEQDAALDKDPENIALPIDRLQLPADDFEMRIAVALHVPITAAKANAAEGVYERRAS